ncbi:MAG: hypothetical protein K2O18_15010 [Oscillospiraceae bacterium]|nr:hypothetical protein [Oscillospiraceae bacterium]
MKKRMFRVRRRMNLVISELNNALLMAGCREIGLRLVREEQGLRLYIQGQYAPEYQHSVERMADLLQPEFRDPALVETYGELTGSEQYPRDGEIALVGQMLSDASVTVAGGWVKMDLYLAFQQ